MSYIHSFTWASMPDSRPADSYLSYADDSIFMDFIHENGIVRLVRISFDGYGCCELSQDGVIPLSMADSATYLDMFTGTKIDQDVMSDIIMQTLEDNHVNIWEDALIEYNLLSNT